MKAKKLLDKYVKKEVREKVGIIVISQDEREKFWYHVHGDEVVPEFGYDTAIHIR